MAYQFADTFDHYNTPSQMYDTIVGSPVISSAYARVAQIGAYTHQGILLPAGSASVRKNLKSNQGHLIVFMSYGGPLPTSANCSFLNFYDSGTWQFSLEILSTGALACYRGAGGSGVLLAQSAAGLITSTTVPAHGIEVEIVFSATVGSVQVWMDGAVVIPLTSGLNTIQTANAYANQVQIGYVSGTGTAIYCDYIRIWDNTGSFQNAPVTHDCLKFTSLPSGPGDLTNWTPNGAVANWQCVNENPPDGDTTYVSSTGTPTDSYAMPSGGFAVAPSMVVAKSYARKDDGATRALEVGVRSSGVNGLGSPVTLGSSYVFVDSCISTDPATGVAPTAAAANAFQHCKFEST